MTLDEVMSISSAELRRKVAELRGWTNIAEKEDRYCLSAVTPHGVDGWVPNYCEELDDAMSILEDIALFLKCMYRVVSYALGDKDGAKLGPQCESDVATSCFLWMFYLPNRKADILCRTYVLHKSKNQKVVNVSVMDNDK